LHLQKTVGVGGGQVLRGPKQLLERLRSFGNERPVDDERAKAQLDGVKKVLVDGSYTGETFADCMKDLLGAEVEVAKRSDLHSFVVIPKRWVVERSFAWLEKCRRVWKNCERLIASSLAMMQLAFIRLLLKRL
jgi:transposase